MLSRDVAFATRLPRPCPLWRAVPGRVHARNGGRHQFLEPRPPCFFGRLGARSWVGVSELKVRRLRVPAPVKSLLSCGKRSCRMCHFGRVCSIYDLCVLSKAFPTRDKAELARDLPLLPRMQHCRSRQSTPGDLGGGASLLLSSSSITSSCCGCQAWGLRAGDLVGLWTFKSQAKNQAGLFPPVDVTALL